MRPWGPFAAGDELGLPPAAGASGPGAGPGVAGGLATRGVKLGVSDADVVAVDSDGDPALVVAGRGSGWVVTCSQPLELLLARVPDAHGPGDASWGVYAGLVELAGARDEAGVDHPDVVTGQLRGAGGGLVVVTNHAASAVRCTVRLPHGAADPQLVGPAGAVALDLAATGGPPLDLAATGGPPLELGPYGAAVVTWLDGAQVPRAG